MGRSIDYHLSKRDIGRVGGEQKNPLPKIKLKIKIHKPKTNKQQQQQKRKDENKTKQKQLLLIFWNHLSRVTQVHRFHIR